MRLTRTLDFGLTAEETGEIFRLGMAQKYPKHEFPAGSTLFQFHVDPESDEHSPVVSATVSVVTDFSVEPVATPAKKAA